MNGRNFTKNHQNYSEQVSLESLTRVVIETDIAVKICISICGVTSEFREIIAYFRPKLKNGYFRGVFISIIIFNRKFEGLRLAL